MKSILKSIVFCYFMCHGFLLSAQDVADARSTELSININNFISRYLSFSDRDFSIEDPYTMMIHRSTTNKDKFFRFGFGLDLRFTNDKVEDDFGTDDERSTRGISTNLRFGVEKRKMIHPRFRMHYGQDVVLGYNSFKTESDQGSSFESNGRGFLVGYGPVVGISFLINDRISIWTESTLYLTYSNFRQESSFNGQNGDIAKTSELVFDIQEPLSINFKIKL